MMNFSSSSILQMKDYLIEMLCCFKCLAFLNKSAPTNLGKKMLNDDILPAFSN